MPVHAYGDGFDFNRHVYYFVAGTGDPLFQDRPWTMIVEKRRNAQWMRNKAPAVKIHAKIAGPVENVAAPS